MRELRLTPNPTRVFLFGPWRLVSAGGQRITLDGFYPAVGVPSLLITGVQHAAVEAAHVKRVVCVENLVTFYEVIRSYPRRGWSSHVTTSAPRTGNSTR